MKSHDIGLLLKLICLEQDAKQSLASDAAPYTARGLEQVTGISKSQVNLALNRCVDVGLARKSRRSGIPTVNRKGLLEFIVYGLKYVFPVRPGELTRGMATAFSAPVLEGKLMSAGDYQLVWPDAEGDIKGLRIEPLFKTVPYAARKDSELYRLLALVDAVRLGQPRERNFAADLLRKEMDVRE